MIVLIIQEMEGVTLTSLTKETGRELSSLSQAVGRLRKRMAEINRCRKKADNIVGSIKTPNHQACPVFPTISGLYKAWLE